MQELVTFLNPHWERKAIDECRRQLEKMRGRALYNEKVQRTVTKTNPLLQYLFTPFPPTEVGVLNFMSANNHPEERRDTSPLLTIGFAVMGLVFNEKWVKIFCTIYRIGIKPRSPALQVDSLPAEPQGKPKNTGVGSLSLLQGIFATQESNWGILHCRQILYQLSYQGSPYDL